MPLVVYPSTPPDPGIPAITVHASLAELATDKKLPKDISQLFSAKSAKGVDILIAPAVSVSPGKAAKFDVSRDFEVKDKGNFRVGLVLSLTPVLKDGKVSYSGTYETTEFDGFAKNSDQSPVFNIKKAIFDGTVALGKTTWFSIPSRTEKITVSDSKGHYLHTEYREMSIVIALSFDSK